MDHLLVDVKPTVLLLARSGIAAAPTEEMSRLAAFLADTERFSSVAFAITEQGSPSFKEVFGSLVAGGSRDVLILSCIVPFEPSPPAGSRVCCSAGKARQDTSGQRSG